MEYIKEHSNERYLLKHVGNLPVLPLTFQVHLEERHHLQDLVYPDLETISTNCLHRVPQTLPSMLFQTTFLLIKKRKLIIQILRLSFSLFL